VKETTFFILVIFSLFLLTACSQSRNILGKYRSNFAVNGFFVTRLNLNSDSTFGYRMSGDLIFDTSNGHYKLDRHHLTLYHKPFQPDTSEYKKYGKEAVLLSHALSTNRHLMTPTKYLIRNDKLFVIDSTGMVIKKQFGYSKKRQYLFFGKHWYKRKYYLKRVH
jgi:hypothetical protein